ncbi:hypothetical protein [Streptomyces achromogenes]|uniref:hypothetical protein n=1 Tax=Streptomyces achromogenes TaxID=67255 RepID=UPI003409B84C
MSAGWGLRTTRAVVFAAVCVLLADLGHVLMSDATVPWWALASAAATSTAGAWCPAGRERGLPFVSSVAVAVQTALHEWFSYAQRLSAPAPPPVPSMSMGGGPDDGAQSAEHMTSMDHAMHGMAHGVSAMDSMAEAGHTMGQMSSTGMFAAHLLAALLSGLWLAHGERAAFRILRALAGWLAAPIRLPLGLPAPLGHPRVTPRRDRTAGGPRRLLLVYAITSRGPPPGTAVL